MKYKLLILVFFVFCSANSQPFSLEDLQTKEQVEVALDSAYIWTEQANIQSFTANYFAVEEAVELSGNEEYKARFNAYRAIFFCYLYDNDQFKNYLDTSLAFYEAHEDRVMLTYVYNIKGIYESYVTEDFHESVKWHRKAVSLLQPNNKKLEKIAVDAYFNLAVSSSMLEDWETVIEASSKCIELALKYNKSRLPRMYYHRGFALFKKQDIDGAIENFKLSEELITEIETKTGEKVHYKDAAYLFGFSEVYKVLGDDKKSADYVREYNLRMKEGVYRFSKYTGLRIQKHSGILVDFAKKKEEKAQNELQKSEMLYYSLLVGFGILTILSLLIFILQQRKHQKLNINKNELLRSKNKELVVVKEEIEETLKVKTDFLNSITHELRTPLYAINSITHLVKKNKEKKIDDSQLDILSFSGDHLLRFINDVIDYNLGANNFEIRNLQLESIDLGNLLDKIKQTIKFSLVMNNENSFVFDFDPAVSMRYMIDSLKLSRVIINLLNNASKYTQEGEILFTVKQLSSTPKKNIIQFCVKDTGKGISKAQLDEINIAFNNNLDLVKRIENNASGLGIGLVMVNRLLKLYDSSLIIESDEGIGTTMTFQISFQVATSEEQLLTLTTPNTKKRHILIVDDNRINQLVTTKIIEELGHSCDVVKGGDEAIAVLKEDVSYDFVLMDIMMPGMDGFQAAEIIKKIRPDQRIIALTAISLRENKNKFFDAGFENVIEKPFVIEKFSALIA